MTLLIESSLSSKKKNKKNYLQKKTNPLNPLTLKGVNIKPWWLTHLDKIIFVNRFHTFSTEIKYFEPIGILASFMVCEAYFLARTSCKSSGNVVKWSDSLAKLETQRLCHQFLTEYVKTFEVKDFFLLSTWQSIKE